MIAECFKPDKTHTASFLNILKNVCCRSTHLLNWVYYYFSGVAVSLHTCLLYFLYELLMSF